jgi:hypothetical protein
MRWRRREMESALHGRIARRNEQREEKNVVYSMHVAA